MKNRTLTTIFEGTDQGGPLEEIANLVNTVSGDIKADAIRELHDDVTAMFTGRNPAFRKLTLPYHNLRHSETVVLAAVRLFHGLHCNSINFSARTLFKGILAAYFHDSGMLLPADAPPGLAAESLADHEQRSIEHLRDYARHKGFAEEIIEDCAVIINYTDLNSDPATFDLHSHEVQLAGQVVGSADILAQMADRYYLECLPLLFNELEQAQLNIHPSALQLMEHTANFYANVVLKRLIVTFSNTSKAMRSHFRQRHCIDRNLYIENIEKNVAYLNRIIHKCNTIDCLQNYLRRQPPD